MDVIAVKDYPRAEYSAYWEIGINAKTNQWTARILDWKDSGVLMAMTAAASDMGSARTASQTWVKQHMDQFKRPPA